MGQPEANPRPRGTGGRIAVVTLIAVALPSAGLVWASNVARTQVQRRALAGLAATGHATAEQEEQAWENARKGIEAGASRLSVRTSLATHDQPQAAEAATNILMSGPYADVRLYDLVGTVIGAATESGAIPSGLSPQRAQSEVIGEPVTTGSRTSRQVEVPVSDAGAAAIGRLVVDVDVSQLLGDPGSLGFGRTGTVELVTPAGLVVAGMAGVGTPLQPATDRALAAGGKPATTMVYSPFYRRMNVESFEPLPDQGLGVITAQSQAEVMAGADSLGLRLRVAALGFGVMALTLSTLLGLLLNRRARRLAASELRLARSQERAQRRLGQFLDAMPVGVFVINADGNPYYVNREAERLLGKGVVPGAGLEDLPSIYNAYVAGTDELYPPERTPQVQGLRGNTTHLDDVEILHPEGRVPIEVWGTPVLGEDLSVEYVIAAFADVTDRKRSAEQIDLLGAITAKMAEGIALITVSDGRIAYANPSLETMFGYEPGEMVGLPIHALDAPGDPSAGTPLEPPEEIAASITRAVVATGRWEGELRNIRKDGTHFWCALNISMFDHPQLGGVSISVHTDITARKQAQDAQAQLASIVEASHDAIFAKTLGGIVTSWNQGATRLFGYDAKEMIGSSIDVLVPLAGRDEDSLVRQRVAAGGGSEQYETMRQRKDGTVFPASVTLSSIPDASGRTVGIAAICRDITEHRRAEAALREREELLAAARDQALEASRLKSQFLANMSHEIRTPMNGVLGMAHVLLMTDLNPSQRRHLLSLRDSGQNLLSIINDILDFSKVEAGRLELEERDFNLVASLESVISVLSSPALDKGLDLRLDVASHVPPWVRGDPVRLRQVLINILGNAVKFTSQGSVRLRVRTRPEGQLRFEVVDTGIGIDPSARDRLLDPFSQADASTTRRFGGTGLGLAISRQLVELMNGTLDFESELGRGSTFWFELPLPAAHPPADAAAEAAGISGPDAAWETVTVKPSGGVKPGTRVLVADDAVINQEVSRALLESMGYLVNIVTNGVEALEAVQKEHYDVVLMDCLMPVMDGYEATAAIRRLEGEVRHTPIIALTAAAMSGDRERCLASGMDDYVSKPLDPMALGAALDRCRPGRSPKLPTEPSANGAASTTEEDDGDPALRETLGSLASKIPPDAFAGVLTSFLTHTPVLLADLSGAIDHGDLDLTRNLAHKLKGGMATVGALRLSRLAAQIEGLDPADPERLETLSRQVQEEFARVRRVVTELSPHAQIT